MRINVLPGNKLTLLEKLSKINTKSMTLITTLKVNQNLAITVGDGRVNSFGQKTNDDLRKVYLKDNFCIAFSGETHISPILSRDNIFVPNIIERFVESYNGSNSFEIMNELIFYLLNHNPIQKTELFISYGNLNEVNVHYIKLPSPQINTITSSFGLLYSSESGLPVEIIKKQFEKVLNETLLINEQEILKKLPYKTEKEIIDLLKVFYESVFTELNHKVGNSIGKSIDIAIIHSNTGRFELKENKSIKEIAREQGINMQ